MSKRNRKQSEPPTVAVTVPRLGPPVNLRPAGAHTDRRRTKRSADKAALNKAAFDFPLVTWNLSPPSVDNIPALGPSGAVGDGWCKPGGF